MVHHCSTRFEAAYQRTGFSFLRTNSTATHRVISKTLSQHNHPQYPCTYGRILGFASQGLLARCTRLTGVHFHLARCFGSSFFQIPHWLIHFDWTLSVEALSFTSFPSFFGHPCLIAYLFPPSRAKVRLSLTRFRPCRSHPWFIRQSFLVSLHFDRF